MTVLHCAHCGRETEFLPIYRAIRIVDVSRSTIYYWMDKEWVHWMTLPSKRRLICRESLYAAPRQQGRKVG